MIVEPFSAAHAIELGGDLQTAEVYECGDAFTMRAHGRVVACGGFVPWRMPGQGEALYFWSITRAGAPVLAMTRAALRLIALVKGRQIIASAGSDEGCRWLTLMGFKRANDDGFFTRVA